MTASKRNTLLAERVMGWSAAPDRFLLGNRRWLPRWRFQPEKSLGDAFLLLETASPERYVMGSDRGGEFWVRIEIAGRVGEARHASKPQAITFAIARALGIELEGAEANEV